MSRKGPEILESKTTRHPSGTIVQEMRTSKKNQSKLSTQERDADSSYWKSADEASSEVLTWPKWKRGDFSELKCASLPSSNSPKQKARQLS